MLTRERTQLATVTALLVLGLSTVMTGVARADIAPVDSLMLLNASTVPDSNKVYAVPNPWYHTYRTFASQANTRGHQLVKFIHLPHNGGTMRIYTSRGNQVTTLALAPSATNFFWDGRNGVDNQYVMSDVYVFVVEPTLPLDPRDAGRTWPDVGKLIILR